MDILLLKLQISLFYFVKLMPMCVIYIIFYVQFIPDLHIHGQNSWRCTRVKLADMSIKLAFHHAHFPLIIGHTTTPTPRSLLTFCWHKYSRISVMSRHSHCLIKYPYMALVLCLEELNISQTTHTKLTLTTLADYICIIVLYVRSAEAKQKPKYDSQKEKLL